MTRSANRIAAILLLLCVGFSLAQAEETLQQQLSPFESPLYWQENAAPRITREILEKAIAGTRTYFIANQKKEGNFTYAYELQNGRAQNDDNAVRQAGAIWGLVCIHTAFPTDESREAVLRALAFLDTNTKSLPNGATAFVYPGDTVIRIGTIALLSLALCDLKADTALSAERQAKNDALLEHYLQFLERMRLKTLGGWSKEYDTLIDFRSPEMSPYFNGEALLAYTKLARLNETYAKRLLPSINDMIPKLVERYTLRAWSVHGDEEETRGFYQWGSMAFWQYTEAKFEPHAPLVTSATYALANWQLYRNQLEQRRGNTAYAVEGLMGAYRVAQLNNDTARMKEYGEAATRVIARLMTCQYKGPLMHLNPRLNTLRRQRPTAIGGITESRTGTLIRIDTVQHQAHAMLLVLRYLFSVEPPKAP